MYTLKNNENFILKYRNDNASTSWTSKSMRFSFSNNFNQKIDFSLIVVP